jgi:hypothetical protein
MSFDFNKIHGESLDKDMEDLLINKILYPGNLIKNSKVDITKIVYPEKFPDGWHIHFKIGEYVSFETQIIHILDCIAIMPGFVNGFAHIDIGLQHRIDLNRISNVMRHNYKDQYKHIYAKHKYSSKKRKSPIDIILDLLVIIGKSRVYIQGIKPDKNITGIKLTWNTFYNELFQSMQEVLRFLNVIDSNPEIYKDVYYDDIFLEYFMMNLNRLYAFNKVKHYYRLSKDDLDKHNQKILSMKSKHVNGNSLYDLVHYIKTNLTKPYKKPIKR